MTVRPQISLVNMSLIILWWYELDNVSSFLDTSVLQITNSIPSVLHFHYNKNLNVFVGSELS